jgi:hypothetical protein
VKTKLYKVVLHSPIIADLAHKLLQGPIEIGIGLVAGIGWGIVAACFPHRNEVSTFILTVQQLTVLSLSIR